MRETLSDKLKRWVVTWLPAILGWFGLKHLLDRLLEPLQRQVWAAGLFRQFRRKLPRQHGDAALLRAEHGIVQFGHRDPALRELQAWCENASVGQIEWKLVTGPSGRGKTRLLMELVENMTAAGKPWRAGFLDTAKVRANPDHLNYFARVPENLLFVIDYAERFRDVILALGEAQEVIAERKNNPLVRVILVSRRDSELWTTLASQSKALGDLFENSPLTRLNLRPIAADLESRRKVFEDAFASFAKHFGKKMPVGVTPDLSAAELEDAFYIHAAALLAYRGELDRDLPVQRKQVLELIMKRERLLWNDTVVGHPDLPDALSGEPIEEAATQLTLASLNDGVTRERAVSLLASCANLVGIDAPVLGKIADIFHLLYPGPVWVSGVTPDPAGTFFLSEAADNLVAEAAAKLDGGEAANALTKVNWVAQEWPDSGRRKLALAFAANPEKLLPLAIDVAIESGDPIGQVASEYLAKNASTGLAQRLKPAIPYPTTALRELGEVVESILHDAVSGDDETARAERAARASDLSVRLSDLGRREAALVANEEAAEIYRALAADRPDAFRPNLAASLNNLSAHLRDLGRREAALAANEEAVEIDRALAADRPDAFRPDLAMSLNNLSAHLSDLGRREEALAANEEAVEIRRALAAERPDAFRPDLAASLGARGAVLRGLERHGEAAESFADALRTLSPQFLDLPQAFAALTQSLVRIYLESIQQAGTQPDTDWLEPVLQKLQDIGAIEVGETDDGEATS